MPKFQFFEVIMVGSFKTIPRVSFYPPKGLSTKAYVLTPLNKIGLSSRKIVTFWKWLVPLSTSFPLICGEILEIEMSSRVFHLQTPLDCLKELYPSTHLTFEVPLYVFGCTAYVHKFGPNNPSSSGVCVCWDPLHQRDYKCFHPPSGKYFYHYG